MASRAGRNEITGTAIYHRPTGFKSWMPEPVTRTGSPVRFRSATNALWALSAGSLIVAVISFAFFRKLDDSVDGLFFRNDRFVADGQSERWRASAVAIGAARD